MHRSRQRTLHLLFTLALLLTGGAMTAYAQTLSIFGVDTSGFPDMAAEFILLDAAGLPIHDISPSDFKVSDEGAIDAQFTIDCPEQDPAEPFHAVLVCDRSGSMATRTPSGLLRITLLKRGAKSFLNAVQYVPPTSIAITAFDMTSVIINDFATTSGPLITAIDNLSLGDFTEYDPAFLHDISGGITLLRNRPPNAKRVLIFLTDGEPNHEPDSARIVDAALAANVTIYTITLGMPMTPILRGIAEATGGAAYGDVNEDEQMRSIYASIAFRSQGVKPCKVRWRTGTGCGPNSIFRTFRMVMPKKGLAASSRYTAPARSVAQLITDPLFLWFGSVGPPASTSLPLTITAKGRPLTITGASLPSGAPFQVLDWGGSAPPFDLPEGGSRTLTVAFQPADSQIYSTSLAITSAQCDLPPLTLSGGVTSSTNISQLQLLSPTGGEGYSGCDSVPIRWAGIPPTEPVTIEFSSDDGATWNLVAKDVKGLRHAWAPPGPGTRYKIRVTAASGGDPDSIFAVAGGGSVVADGARASDAYLVNPQGLALVGDILYYCEVGAHVVRQVDLKSMRVTTVAGTRSPGYSNDGAEARTARLQNPTGIAVAGQFLYIADNGNHRVRRVDLTTGIIITVAGTGVGGYSGDGGVGKNAQLRFPSGLVVGRDALYISDRGNGRVRRLDFKTNIITTVAGGGDFPDADGSPAVTAALQSPDGLAWTNDSAKLSDTLYIAEQGANRVRQVDMRTGIISTVAGVGTAGFSGDGKMGLGAQLNAPQGVAVIGDMIYIADTKNHRIRGVNRYTRIITTIAGTGQAGLAGDNGNALAAKMNNPTGLAGDRGRLFLADHLNDRIRRVLISSAGRSDSSRRSFSVTVAHLSVSIAGRSASFPSIAIGESRDSVIDAAVCNTGTVPFALDSVAIIGANAADFRLVSGISSAMIAPGECVAVEVRFRPSALGVRTARMVFFGTCAGSDTLALTGRGVAPCGLTALEHVDFGSMAVGQKKDSVIESILCNRGTTTLAGRAALIPADGSFSITAGGGSFSLAPGECLKVTVRFTATTKGTASALLDFGVPTACGREQTILVGHGLTPQTLSASDLSYPVACWTGARDTTLAITNSGDAPLVVTGIELVANNEGFSITSAIPSIAAPLVIAPNRAESVAIRFNPASVGAKSATLRISSNDPASPAQIALTGRRDSIGILFPATLRFDGQRPAPSYPLDTVITIINSGTLPISLGDAAISGADSARFEIPSGQLPRTIAPGDSARLHVRLLGPTTGSAYNAQLALALDGACDTTPRLVRLLASGSAPALVATVPTFRALVCADEHERDTVVILSNPGGSLVTISSIEILPASGSGFTLLGSAPIQIPPGGTASIPIRFSTLAPGSYQAELRLKSDAPGGDSSIQLSARRELVDFIVVDGAISFGRRPRNASTQRADTLVNTGSLPITLMIGPTTSSFRPLRSGSITLQPGERLPLDVLFSASAAGHYSDTLVVIDERCAIARRVALDGDIYEPIRTIIRLPRDSSARDVVVEIPLWLKIEDRASFEASGAVKYETTISFDGRVLMPVDAVGATIITSSYDDRTAAQTVTLSGSRGALAGSIDADGWEKLAVLRCRVPSSDRIATALHFESFAWDRPDVLADTIDGTFAVSGECAPGLRMASQIRISKLVPQPVTGRDDITAELELESPQEVECVVIDGAGHTLRTLPPRWMGAGRQVMSIDLDGVPSGAYWIVVRSGFGTDVERVVIVR